MKIIEPSVELWEEKDYISHVAKCARVCYGKETGDDNKTVNNLLTNNHLSVFRHSTRYYIVKRDFHVPPTLCDFHYIINNKNNKVCGINIRYDKETEYYYVVLNGNYVLDNCKYVTLLDEYKVTATEFNSTKIGHEMMRYTFAIITQISTSRELNRVSPNNITEQSTRYVYEDGSIVRPHWLNQYEVNKFNSNIYDNLNLRLYLDSCDTQFKNYKKLVDNGMKRQDARGVLPLDTATKVIYTYSVEEWKHILKLRCDKRSHPNAQIIANAIKYKLENLGYKF